MPDEKQPFAGRLGGNSQDAVRRAIRKNMPLDARPIPPRTPGPPPRSEPEFDDLRPYAYVLDTFPPSWLLDAYSRRPFIGLSIGACNLYYIDVGLTDRYAVFYYPATPRGYHVIIANISDPDLTPEELRWIDNHINPMYDYSLVGNPPK